MKEKLKIIMSIVIIIPLLIGFVVGVYFLKRKINYSFAYKAEVIKTIHQENKPLLKRIKKLEKEIIILKNKTKFK